MGENTFSLALILIGGFIIDSGFLYLSASKLISLPAILAGAMLFWHGFRRLS